MAESRFLIVAVDGGAASGKSSTSRAISERFGLLHVDTGSFYRAVTFKLLELGVAPDDPSAVETALARLRPGTRVEGRSARMEIDGWTPGDEIRSARVNDNVSRFAALPVVRRFLLDYQRGQADVARRHGFEGLVMEGRDIGSVIFPDADLRIFLEASSAARAARRAAEGHVDQIHERDRLDTQRKTAPLVCPVGAVPIDSTHLSLSEVVDRVATLVRSKLGT
ncbi:(d)CMP kinase [Opitutales bacterium ASA1]|uniref:(d)CMP kinase n=1 Tax=Congregicoccus parvus TaxID=3081749 RepID=UPI002B2A2409|nr:(d)CMP kinase [Opitutales bacterium ASA1]